MRWHLRKAFPVAAWACVSFPAQAQGVCLPIDTITLRDAPALSSQEAGELTAPFAGRCLGLAEFDAVLEAVTLAYVDRGLILSRAYLPEQDLSDGELEIAVVEGELTAITMNGAGDPRWSGRVFPGLVGHPVNIRDVEQGLDQIEAMPRWSAEMVFEPGRTPGESVMAVTAQSSQPTQYRLATHNRGSETAGEWVTTLGVNTTHLLGINDTWDLSVSKSLDPHPLALGDDGDTTRSAALSFDIPYGRWSLGYGLDYSDYDIAVPGAFSDIPTSGSTVGQELTADYVVFRDTSAKHTIGVALSRVATENFIAGVQIDASSRVITGLEMSYGVTDSFMGGDFEGRVYIDKGLQLLGAEDAKTQPAGAPDAQYLLYGLQMDYRRQVTSVPGLTWDVTFQGQVSADRLYGGQAFSIGGTSTVRGSKGALASGSSGIVLRNEAEMPLPISSAEWLQSAAFYGALDYGRIFSQPDVDAAEALGGVLGLKLGRDGLSLDISYQEVLTTSEGLTAPEGGLFVSVEWRF